MALILATLLILKPALAAVRYDQAQTGDYNVHLDLKNIEVLAFLDSSSLSLNDYDYDYGDYTLKPPGNTSNSTDVSTDSSNSTAEATVVTTNSSDTATPSNSSQPLEHQAGVTGIKLETSSTPAPASSSTHKPPRRCGAGFYRDQAGRCRRLRRPINKLSGLLQQAKNRISGK